MPKMKVHKATAKRVRPTKNGKFARRRGFIGHFMEKKTGGRKRNNQVGAVVHSTRVRGVKKSLGL
jgi:large subunit ribosomal protein L35